MSLIEPFDSGVRIERVVDCRNCLGEAPMWHPKERALYWVDAFAPSIQRWRADTGEVSRWDMPELTASLVFRANGGVVAAMKSGFKFVDLESGAVVDVVDPEPDKPDNWLNDGKCDRLGRYWCGSVDSTMSEKSGSLYRLDGDRAAHKMDTGFIVSNGMAWSPDDAIMYFADSRSNIVYKYDFDLSTGSIANRRQFISTADIEARVDGATVDCEGNYWCAHIADWHIACYDSGGKIIRRIRVPVQYPTMCTFGGEKLDTLFVTSSTQILNEQEATEQPLAGSLLAITDLGAQGIEEPFYAS